MVDQQRDAIHAQSGLAELIKASAAFALLTFGAANYDHQKTVAGDPTPVPARAALDSSSEFASATLPAIVTYRPDNPVMLFGGGGKPELATELFSVWAGRDNVLVITWGSKIPDTYFEKSKANFLKAGVKNVIRMPDLPDALAAMARSTEGNLDPLDPRRLIMEAKGIFIEGGDQSRIENALRLTKTMDMLAEWSRSNRGPIGGTSAGTAIMAGFVIAGDGTPGTTSDSHPGQNPIQYDRAWAFVGPGVLYHMVTDQHFDQRPGRLERLMEVLAGAPAHILWGIGVDESSAAIITENRYIDVIGNDHVTVIPRNDDSSCGEPVVLSAGQRFDMKTKSVIGMRSVPRTVGDFEILALASDSSPQD